MFFKAYASPVESFILEQAPLPDYHILLLHQVRPLKIELLIEFRTFILTVSSGEFSSSAFKLSTLGFCPKARTDQKQITENKTFLNLITSQVVC